MAACVHPGLVEVRSSSAIKPSGWVRGLPRHPVGATGQSTAAEPVAARILQRAEMVRMAGNRRFPCEAK